MAELLSSDGLPARASGPWAQDKLNHLTRYADMVTTAMKNKFTGGLTFVDLMAGPGRCIDTRSPGRPEFDGSTLLALQTQFPFSRVVAVESDQESAAALRARVSGHVRATVIEGDCNSTQVVTEVRRAMEGALTLMFVDLLGTEVDMSTLRALTHQRLVDLVITWPEMDVNRNRGMMYEQPERWSAFFGTEEWLSIGETVGPGLRLRALQRLYVRQLETMGFAHHCFVRGIRNRRGGVLYRPLYASRNPLGLKFWHHASAVSEQSQPRLW